MKQNLNLLPISSKLLALSLMSFSAMFSNFRASSCSLSDSLSSSATWEREGLSYCQNNLFYLDISPLSLLSELTSLSPQCNGSLPVGIHLLLCFLEITSLFHFLLFPANSFSVLHRLPILAWMWDPAFQPRVNHHFWEFTVLLKATLCNGNTTHAVASPLNSTVPGKMDEQEWARI